MLNKIGVENIITSNPEVIKNADKIILPGVGSFDIGMQNLQKLNLINVLHEAVVIDKKPILGICLGMQLMTLSSEEGVENGLKWLPIKVIHFKKAPNYKGTVPVMGWNYVQSTKTNKLLDSSDSRFYFVHSYHCQSNDFQILSAQIDDYEYCAAFQKENIFGVQFHPEKSHKFGLDLLVNFCNL